MVSKFSLELEYRVLPSIVAELIWLQALLHKLGVKLQQIQILWFDNTSAQSLATNPVFHSRTTHIGIDVHFIREIVANKMLEFRYMHTEEQLVDIMTKSLSISHFFFY